MVFFWDLTVHEAEHRVPQVGCVSSVEKHSYKLLYLPPAPLKFQVNYEITN
jgi:hypothetical protein